MFHHARASEAHERHGLPVTTSVRTLLDLAATCSRAEIERACSEALVPQLTTAEELARQQGRGSAVLARLTSDGMAPTRSALERRFLRAVVQAGLPRPLVNQRIGRHEVDFLWPAQRLAVELDGWRFHGHRLAFERDRARDAELQLLGYTVLRFTWHTEAAAATATIARFLTRPASRRAS